MVDARSDLTQAHETVRTGERALKDAEYQFDTNCGPDDVFLLITEIKLAEHRFVEATAKPRDLEHRG